jgi:hypothetical protein
VDQSAEAIPSLDLTRWVRADEAQPAISRLEVSPRALDAACDRRNGRRSLEHVLSRRRLTTGIQSR